MSLIFEARELCRKYGEVMALSLPEFWLEEGECVALTGHNGSGKSTLLRLLAFLEEPSSGELYYYGDTKTPRREISLLLQDPYLMCADVFWNVTLGLRLRGQKSGLKKAYDEAMKAVGFAHPEELAKRGPRALSGGEVQRVALASRLILSPRVLLLDEPTSNVDAASARAIHKAVLLALSKGTCVVIATHDRALIDALPAREIALHHGEDTPEIHYDAPLHDKSGGRG